MTYFTQLSDWEFDLLNIYNYKKNYGSLRHAFSFISSHHNVLEGDILEAGVYQGRTTLSLAIMLSDMKSQKHIYGYDTFNGFPPVMTREDEFKQFEYMLAAGCISQDHYNAVLRYWELKRLMSPSLKLDASSISTSADFSSVDIDNIYTKINFLGINNITLEAGDFAITMNQAASDERKYMCVIMDCDLYASYKQVFKYAWPRVVRGGMIYLDEYYSLKFPGARTASLEFIEINKDADLRQLPSHDDEFERWCIFKS